MNQAWERFKANHQTRASNHPGHHKSMPAAIHTAIDTGISNRKKEAYKASIMHA